MNELVVFDEVIATLAEYKAKNEKLVFDYADPEGEKAARSHINKLRKVKTKISDVHKEAKADALAFGRALDGKKRELTGKVDGMIAVHQEPLDAIKAEMVAKAMEKVRIIEEAEAKRLAELEAREAKVREAEEKVIAEKVEAEQRIAAEQARADQVEREKRIAEEAAERAKIQAEQKAKADAEAKELAEIRCKEEAEATENKRIANKKHREAIENDICNSFTAMGFNPDATYSIVEALKNDRIPHVSIKY